MTEIKPLPIHCVLFDLDGTLVDSMGDLIAALDAYLKSIGVNDFTPDKAYNVPIHSATSFLSVGLGREPTSTDKNDFITLYANMPRTHTHEYAQVDTLLASLTKNKIPWGIMTNKPKAIAEEEIIKFGYDKHALCTVYGDTLAVKKPNPEPLLLCAELANIAPKHCVYIGDSASDIDAGINAGMQTVGVSYGYSKTEKVAHADYVVDSVKRLNALLDKLLSDVAKD